MIGVSRHNPIPLWRQLKSEVRDRLVPELRPGDQIPGENELCERYGISRTVVRQALGSLVNDGVLFRRQGHGTFVAPGKLEQSPLGGELSGGDFRSEGALEFRLLGVEELPPTERVARWLRVTGHDGVYRIHWLLHSGGDPIGYQVDTVPRHLCPGLISDEPGLLSLERTLADRYGLVPASVSVTVECVTADAERVQWLGVEPDAPLLMVARVFHLSTGEPVRLSRTRYRHDRFQLAFPSLPLESRHHAVSHKAT
jgi:GntR family transcriptional regulator